MKNKRRMIKMKSRKSRRRTREMMELRRRRRTEIGSGQESRRKIKNGRRLIKMGSRTKVGSGRRIKMIE